MEVPLTTGASMETEPMMDKLQDAIVPESTAASSTTYSFHIPFGSLPLNVAKVGDEAPVAEAKDPGPGELKLSGLEKLVGLNDPEASAVACARLLLAESLKTRLSVVAEPVAPQSDIRIILCPVGDSSNMSTSPLYVCARFVIVTLTSSTDPINPETLIESG